MSEITITKSNFDQEVLKSDMPILVDFWATWCGPCKMIAPVLSELATKHADKLKVGKVNVDENMELAQQYRVASIPTLLYFKDGELVKQTMGFMPLAEIEQWLGL
ncbi:MAG: thioredoxin [Lachnospiraceae bacterium]|nr:thioredoxin [Lachnospiraceae bacterium]